MWTWSYTLVALVSVLTPMGAPAQSYLLRIEHQNRETHSCALAQNTGAFHLEAEDGRGIRVIEGTLSGEQLLGLRRDLNNGALATLSQEQIEEPIVRDVRDLLQLDIFRHDRWQNLLFQTAESQEPFKRSLQPLVRWLDRLSGLPHRELSEDAGKNNCLPPKKIALKQRSARQPQQQAGASAYLKPSIAMVPPAPGPPPASAVLRLVHVKVGFGTARQKCVLFADDGKYRFEDQTQRSQRTGLNTRVMQGRINEQEMLELRTILEQQSLREIRHHEPPGGIEVRMMGDMLHLWIARDAGFQEIVLSTNQRQTGYFYTGDGASSAADPLLKFVAEHVESNTTMSSARRNECTEIP
jgi:hypothetical protein